MPTLFLPYTGNYQPQKVNILLMKTPELLAPAGNFEKLKTAIHYGADAVYMGISGLSLRAKADNFTFKELQQAAGLVRSKGVRRRVARCWSDGPPQALD